MGKKRKTNNKDAGKKTKKQATPRAPSAAPAASPAGGMSDTLLKMKFMQKASPAPAAAPAAAAPVVSKEPPERKLFGRRSFGGFNREIERNEASFYRAHGLRYDVMPAAEAPKAMDFGAYSQGRRKDKGTSKKR
jgi:hypothetical protein